LTQSGGQQDRGEPEGILVVINEETDSAKVTQSVNNRKQILQPIYLNPNVWHSLCSQNIGGSTEENLDLGVVLNCVQIQGLVVTSPFLVRTIF
jgi:hypothetical protein